MDASALGRLRIHIPKSALASLSGARIVKAADGALVREVPSAELENACLLPAGQYAVRDLEIAPGSLLNIAPSL